MPNCSTCHGMLYDSSDEQTHSWTCLMCGRTWYAPDSPPTQYGPLPPLTRGRPRKGGPA